MCTVTFFPIKEGFVLTSSRDEQKHRSTIAPQFYNINNNRLFFPKDELAGGSWIASDDKTKTVCLLNGAFQKHQRKSSYRKSRGLIVLDSFSFSTFHDFANEIDLEGIEPFTLLLIDSMFSQLSFIELRWDEHKKHINKIDVTKPHIWSSATLYDEDVRIKREIWFKQLISSNKNIDRERLYKFHLSKHEDEPTETDIVMKRAHGLQTISISQVVSKNDKKEFRYHDLITNQKTEQLLNGCC